MMDPLQYGVELRLEGRFHPLGFPLHVATNSPDVLAAAEASWSVYDKRFEVEPFVIHVVVEAGGAAGLPVYRGQRNLLTITSDKDNHAVCDYTRRFGYCRLSTAAASDAPYAGYYFLEAMAYHMLTQLYVTPVHAACVSRGESGVALCGPSGAGKSTLAYACAKAGWDYVSDNESWLVRGTDPPVLVGNPSRIRIREDAVRLFPELAGLPVVIHANGKRAMSLGTSGLMTGDNASPRWLLFPERQKGADGLVAMTREETFEVLLAGVPLYEPHVRHEHEESLRLLAGRPAFRLRYSSPESGVAMLEELVRRP